MNPKIFTILKDGQTITYDVILTFKSTKSGRDYIVYTDNEFDSDSKLKIYAAIYNPLTMEYIANVENQDEWLEINELLKKVL